MREYIDIEDLHILISLQRDKRKTLSISIGDGRVLNVKAPMNMSERQIERFIHQKQFWIYKQMKRHLELEKTAIHRSDAEIKELKERARIVLTQKTEMYSKLMETEYTKIRIGNQRTCWGSCSGKGTISYNWHLVLMPDEIQDYVVVHELSHTFFMNHSKQFWEFVGKYIPDYEDRRRWLKRHGDEYL